MVNKIEQFNSMKDHTQHMTDVTMRMLQNINDRKDEFKDIQRTIKEIEQKYEAQFNPIYSVYRELSEVVMEPPKTKDEQADKDKK